jgi:hypothetical protein
VNDFDAIINSCALAMARRHNLVCATGEIVCWGCGDRLALLPSLHCGACLGAHYARHHITTPWCPNRAQSPAKEVA